MPSTYTVNLGIEKPATGEQSGTWGDTTNVNFDILDQAINGAVRVTLTSAGSSGSPNALQITNGATSDGRNKWVEFYSSGDLGGSAYVQLDPNDAEKIVFVRNSLASSRSVILFQGTYNSARDLEIPAGVDMVVKFDGGGASAATVTDVYTKLRVTELTTPTLTATTADINGGTLDNSVIGGTTAAAITGTTIVANTSLNIAGDGATVTGIKDEDNMASNSATKLATQQSIKAYVDSQVGTVDTLAEILANGNTSGSNNLIINNGQALTSNTINETTAGSGVTIDSVLLKDDVVKATDVETGSISANDGTAAATIANSTGNFTITNFISNSVDIGGGAIDGTNIGASSAGTGNFTSLTSTGLTVNGDPALNGNVTITNTGTGAAAGPYLTLDRNSSSPADSDLLGILSFRGRDDGANATDYGTISGKIADVTGGTEDGVMLFNVISGGSSRDALTLSHNESVFNNGSADQDFRVESNSNTHALFVDASADQIGVGTSAPSERLTVKSSGSGTETVAVEMSGNLVNLVSLGQNSNGHGEVYVRTNNGIIQHSISADGGVVFNEGSLDQNFRIESNSDANAFFVDGGTNNIGIGTATTYAHQQGTAIDMVYSSTIWAGGTYWAGGLKLGETFYVTTSGEKYKHSSRQATMGYYNSQGGSIHFYSAPGGTADDVITWQELAEFDRDEVVFNNGSANQDFRVESNSNFTALFVDAGNSRVGINEDVPDAPLHVTDTTDGGTSTTTAIQLSRRNGGSNDAKIRVRHDGSDGISNVNFEIAGTERFRIADTETVVNEQSVDYDFRVESDGNANMLFVDAGNDHVNIGTSSDLGQILNVNGGLALGTDPTVTWTSNYLKFQTRSASVPVIEFLASASGNYAPRLDVMNGAGTVQHRIDAGGATTFNETGADNDFRVESNADANALFLDAGTGHLAIGSGSTSSSVNINDEQAFGRNVGADNSATLLVGKRHTANNTNAFGVAGTTHNTYYPSTFVIDSAYTANLTTYYLTAYGVAFSGWSSAIQLKISNGASATYNMLGISVGGGVVINEESTSLDFRVESDANSHCFFVNAAENQVTMGNTSDALASRALFIKNNQYPQQNYATNASVNYPTLQLRTAYATGGQTATQVDFRNGADGLVGTIKSTVSVTSYNTSSDQRLKENIVNAPSASDDIDAIQVRSFDWKVNNAHQKYGLVAQELLTVAPDAVAQGDTEEEMMGVDYSKLVPMLVKEIQSLRARVAQLENT